MEHLMASNGCALELLSCALETYRVLVLLYMRWQSTITGAWGSSDDQKTVLQAILPLTTLLITITPSSGNTGRPFLVPQLFKSRNKLAFSTCRSNECSNLKVSVKALHLKINAQQSEIHTQIFGLWSHKMARLSLLSKFFRGWGRVYKMACNHQIRSAMANPAGIWLYAIYVDLYFQGCLLKDSRCWSFIWHLMISVAMSVPMICLL